MNTTNLILGFFIFLNFTCYSQNLETIERICDSIYSKNSYSYKMIRKKVGLYASDTGRIDYKCSFKLSPSDSIAGVHYNVFLEQYNKEKIYDGEYYSQIVYKDSIVKFFKVCKETQKFHGEIFSNYGYYTSPYMIAKQLSSAIESPNIAKLKITKNDNGIQVDCTVKQDYWFSDLGKLIKPKKMGSDILQNNFRLQVDTIKYLPIRYERFINLEKGGESFHGYTGYQYVDYTNSIQYPIEPVDRIPKGFRIKDYKEKNNTKLENQVKSSIEIGTNAKSWSMMSSSGDSVKLIYFYGKPLILEFGFFGCAPCMQSIPILNHLKTKYENEINVVFINVTKLDIDKANKLKKAYEIKYELLINGQDVAKDYGLKAFPKTYFIDSSGIIRAIEGFSLDSHNKWENNILKLIN